MNYKIKEDILLTREFYQLTQDELANLIGVDKITISRTENDETYPREELMNKFYNYCFEKGLRLNIQKEMLYKDDLSQHHILLTHASKSEIDGKISLDKGRANNDFDKGFYCGDSYDKSVSFVCRFPSSCVYFIDFNPDKLQGIQFEVSTKWMLAIAYFRGKLEKYKGSKVIKRIINQINKADYIVAPIADNRMFQIIDTFIDGEITDEQCKHCLAATNLGMQYVFITQRALDQICILERCFVSSKEKEYYQKEQMKFQKDGEDKSRLARIHYRGKGKYIEEILK